MCDREAAIREQTDAPCNICGRGWPYHVDACSYAVTARELAAARVHLTNEQAYANALRAELVAARELETALRVELRDNRARLRNALWRALRFRERDGSVGAGAG